jgi:hypothetical protein
VQSVDWSPTTECTLPDQETSERRPYAPQGATGSIDIKNSKVVGPRENSNLRRFYFPFFLQTKLNNHNIQRYNHTWCLASARNLFFTLKEATEAVWKKVPSTRENK